MASLHGARVWERRAFLGAVVAGTVWGAAGPERLADNRV